MRRYQPAWNKLKQDKQIVIVSHRGLHPRILKAVIKEKDIDLLYKYELSERYERMRIAHTSSGSTLTITISISLTIPDF